VATSHYLASMVKAFFAPFPTHGELINGPFLFRDKGSPAEYGAGVKLVIERGWLTMHQSGTFVRFTPAGAELRVKFAH
jgi:hypothetical protein